MKIVFAGKRKSLYVLRFIASSVAQQGDSCEFYSSLQELMNEIKMNPCIDLFVFDFRLYNICHDYVSGMLEQRRLKIPIIFYNDPLITSDALVAYWLSRNQKAFSPKTIDKYTSVFKRLHEAIEDPSIRPFIDVFQPLFTFNSAEQKNPVPVQSPQRSENPILPPSLANLFDFFYQNRNRNLSLDEISQHIFGTQDSNGTLSTVYSYISRLKKYLSADRQKGLKLVRVGRGTYRLLECTGW